MLGRRRNLVQLQLPTEGVQNRPHVVDKIRHGQDHDCGFFAVNRPHDAEVLVRFEDELDVGDVRPPDPQIDFNNVHRGWAYCAVWDLWGQAPVVARGGGLLTVSSA